MDEKKQMSRRKALAAIGTVGVAAAGSGAGTYAYLSDEKSLGTRFETGSLLVSVSPSNGTLENLDLDEGEQSDSTIKICNEGTLPVRNVLVSGVNFRSKAIDDPEVIAGALDVVSIQYDGVDVTSALLGSSSGTLQDLATNVNGTEGGVSLSVPAGSSGLASDDNEDGASNSRCKTLVVTTEMNYANLPDGYSDTKITVNLDFRAEQKPQGQ